MSCPVCWGTFGHLPGCPEDDTPDVDEETQSELEALREEAEEEEAARERCR